MKIKPRMQSGIERAKLLVFILDELCYVAFSKTGAELLFDVASRAYERVGLIVATNLHFEQWAEVPGSERLVIWGMAIYRREEKIQANPGKLPQRFAQTRKTNDDLESNLNPEDEIRWRMGAAGPAYVAAVLVRDHWNGLAAEEQDWVATVIADAVSRDSDSKDDFFPAGKLSMDASRPAAFVLPALFNCGLGSEGESQLLQNLVHQPARRHNLTDVVAQPREGVI